MGASISTNAVHHHSAEALQSCVPRRAASTANLHVLAAYPSWVVTQGHRPFTHLEPTGDSRAPLYSSGSSLPNAASSSLHRHTNNSSGRAFSTAGRTPAAASSAAPTVPAPHPTRPLFPEPAGAAAAAAAPTAAVSPLSARFRTHPRPLTHLERAAAVAQQAATGDDLAADMYDNDGEGWHLGGRQQQQQSRAGGVSRPGSAPEPSAPPARNPTPGLFDILSSSAGQLPSANDLGMAPTPSEPERRFRGVLQSVPVVSSSKEHLQSALKRASRVAHSAGIRNEAERERNKAARQMDLLMKELSVPLTRYVNGFPDPARLHPFEQALLQLTVGIPLYKSVLLKVDNMRKTVLEVGKSFASKASAAPSKQAAIGVAAEGFTAVEGIYRTGARYVDNLKEVAKALRALPQVEYDVPTLALVGAPNVGKSSLVKILSSGTPEVCNYPFTTRSIKMGHFYLDARKHQVTDTPGLLARPDEERNKMEQLTLAALGCLPTSVLFVMDLTEECGTSVADQWAIRNELRARFPGKPWVDVFSKSDMLGNVFDEVDGMRALPPEGSVEQGAGVSKGVEYTLTAPRRRTALGGDEVLVAGDGQQVFLGEDVSDEEAGRLALDSAYELAGALPRAIRVSSLTHDGLESLQTSIVAMLQKAQAERDAAEAEAKAAAAAAAAEGEDGEEAEGGGGGAADWHSPVSIGPRF
ncbi:MAG: hypothetical protein WDW36_005010 [Sanguina aurantia]